MNQKPYQYCVYLLSKQDYSEFKIRQKLKLKGYLPHEIDETLEKLKGMGLLREENYRRLFIKKWMLKGESPEKIRQRGSMEKLGFEAHHFEEVSSELGISEEDKIERLITKKLRSKIIPKDFEEKTKLKEKIIRFLLSKGHDFQDIKKAISRYF